MGSSKVSAQLDQHHSGAGVVLLLLPSSNLTCVVSSLCIEKCALCYWEWSGMVTWLVLVLGMSVELAEVLFS